MTAGRTENASTDLFPPDEIGEIPENLYREPLEVIYADHFRALVACRLLDSLIDPAGDPAAPRLAAAVRQFLEHDLPANFADEEEDLFPLLRARCTGEDKVEELLALLTGEHAQNGALATAVIEQLGRLAAGKPVRNAPRAHEQAALFGELLRRHLAWENGWLLSLARQRLTPADLSRLGRSMAARHGVDYPE